MRGLGRAQLLTQQLRLLFLLKAQLPPDLHHRALPQKAALLFQHPGKNQQVHGPIHILQSGKGHLGPGPGGLAPHPGDNAQQNHPLAILIAHSARLAPSALLDIQDSGAAALSVSVRVSRHGMAAQVHARDLFLHGQLFPGGEVLRLGDIPQNALPHDPGGVEEAHLALQVPVPVPFQAAQHLFHSQKHLPAVAAHAVQGPALD